MLGLPRSITPLPMLLLAVATFTAAGRPISFEARQPAGSLAVPPRSRQAPPLISTLVVLATGIDARQRRTQHFDPYGEAYRTFEATLRRPELDCPPPTTAIGLPASPASPVVVAPPFDHTHGPLVLCGASGVAWLPYSYAGVFDDPGAVASYFGDTTGQALASSVTQLRSILLAKWNWTRRRPKGSRFVGWSFPLA